MTDYPTCRVEENGQLCGRLVRFVIQRSADDAIERSVTRMPLALCEEHAQRQSEIDELVGGRLVVVPCP